MAGKTELEKKKDRLGPNYSAKSKTDTLTSDKAKKIVDGCVVCNKKKCYKYHLDAKSNNLSKKTPDDVVLKLKQHMLNTITSSDCSSICKIDSRTSQWEVDIVKMHEDYIEQHEKNNSKSNIDTSKDTLQPKIKKWLYRKIFLDEFKTFDLSGCKHHLDDLRRSIESTLEQKKKKTQRGSKVVSNAQATSAPVINQSLPQDYSVGGHVIGMTSIGNPHPASLSQVHGSQPNLGQTNSAAYQPNLLNINVEPPPPHPPPPLAAYIPQQLQHNILFQQQQPLNLQTSTHSLQPHTLQTTTPASANPLNPLNLQPHPYYVSFSPVLPLHMSAQQQHTAHHFQSNVSTVPQQPHQPTLHSFNHQHAMYQ